MLIKALTLHQPGASMMAFEAKTIETRSWKTDYRGPLAIHAAKTTTHLTGDVLCALPGFKLIPEDFVEWPLGQVVAIVELVDIRAVEDFWYTGAFVQYGPHEKGLGDYSRGRYAWKTKMIKFLDPPIPARGKQGLWNWQVPDHLGLEGILK